MSGTELKATLKVHVSWVCLIKQEKFLQSNLTLHVMGLGKEEQKKSSELVQ